MAKRFVWNRQAGEVHDREHLDERCNTDSIKDRKDLTLWELLDEYLSGPLNLCAWCCADEEEE